MQSYAVKPTKFSLSETWASFFVPWKRQWMYILLPLIDKFWLSVS